MPLHQVVLQFLNFLENDFNNYFKHFLLIAHFQVYNLVCSLRT